MNVDVRRCSDEKRLASGDVRERPRPTQSGPFASPGLQPTPHRADVAWRPRLLRLVVRSLNGVQGAAAFCPGIAPLVGPTTETGRRLDLSRCLAFATAHGKRQRPKTLAWDRCPTLGAIAVTAVSKPRERRVDPLEHLALDLRERQPHVVTRAHRVSAAVLEMLTFRRVSRPLQLLADPLDNLSTTLLQELDEFGLPSLPVFGP